MQHLRAKGALLAVSMVVWYSGCVVEPARRAPVAVEVVTSRPPPAIREEYIPPPPRGRAEVYAWKHGYWRWNGRDYVWVKGHYEKRPATSAVWISDAWVARGNQWVLVPGHWEYK